MRHFVYLDTDTLNSYLSQINGGLLKSIVNESKDEVATTKNENTSPGKSNFTTEVGFKPILNLKFSEDKDVINTTNTLSQIETGRELIEKILHDNSLDQFSIYLDSNNLIIDSSIAKVGDYVEFEDEFSIRDLDYLYELFSDEFVDFCIENTRKESKNFVESEEIRLKNITNKNTLLKEIRKQSDELVKSQSEGLKQTRKMLNLARSIMPFSKYIISNNCVMPLVDKYLRNSTDNIRFTYSGKMHVIGRYTSDLKDAFAREGEIRNEFDKVLDSIDKVFEALYKDTLGLDESMKIVIPIALYFE
ncbi:DUF6414 family protein [Clostridium beijerinckii]|uniref:Uncharacterized protein n=1 Tax=Clostridium beijerinckii TaxID=1520 RepID=A0AAE5H6P6_CLOBE|nr:hypothetical protein [Clostridium beijerinckii]NSB15813.1 hypothetical protein [Clostridium beijerinckii]OOM19427.1 hypothetical protein CLOBE_53300 [Clostridium beijerinckii]